MNISKDVCTCKERDYVGVRRSCLVEQNPFQVGIEFLGCIGIDLEKNRETLCERRIDLART